MAGASRAAPGAAQARLPVSRVSPNRFGLAEGDAGELAT